MTESVRPLLYRYFRDSADVLLAEHARSGGQRASTNLGRNRELFCGSFLNHILPPRISVGSGEVWDSRGHKTGQLDLILTRDDCPSLAFGSDNTYLCEGVFAVLEVKSNLTRDKLQEALDTLRKVAELRPRYGIVMMSGPVLHRALRCIVAYESATWETLVEELLLNEANHGVADLVCVISRGALVAKGLLLEGEEKDLPLVPVAGRAASLGMLYLHLVTYATSFIARPFGLSEYFEPMQGWNDYADAKR